MRSTIFGIAIVCAVFFAGCYDSQWGEVKRSQARNAQAALPAHLESHDSEDTPRLVQSAKPYRIRIYATPSYVRQTFDWEKRVRALIDDVNQVLASDLHARLEIDSMSSWTEDANEDSLEESLKALHSKDPGDGVDWVAGFIGGISKVDPSFHELGFGDVPGKYIVLRSVSMVGERDSIDRAFDQLSEDERTRVSRARKEHRATSVCLHEIGHTLAAIHERDERSLMNARYDPKMAGFSEAAIGLMRVSLDHRDHLTTPDEIRSYARDLTAVLNGPSAGTWIEAERVDLVKRLDRYATPQPTPAPSPAPSASTVAAPEPPPPDDPLLPSQDQAIARDAFVKLHAGDAATAGTLAKPLFSRYPKVYSVQDLRCQIAMKRDGWPAAEPECKPIMKLSR